MEAFALIHDVKWKQHKMLMVHQTKFTATSCKGIISVIVFFPVV